MKNKFRMFVTFAFLLPQFGGWAQQLHYSREESNAIHDSIQQSRWDVGGRLSHYSFRYMSEFFPTGIIQKSNEPFVFNYNPKKTIEAVSVKTKNG